MPRRSPLPILAALLLSLPAVARGQEEAAATAAEGAARPRVELFPTGKLYPEYLADPRRPGFGLMQLVVTDVRVPDSGQGRVALKLGGRFGLLRFPSAAAPDRPWQISIEAGFYGQFDQAHRLDNLGWDGIYGFLLTRRLAGGTAVKLGTLHVSSHIGDEYLERTGRGRVNYTREELVAAASWPLAAEWSAYLEGGWAYDYRTPGLQAPWRTQGGVELERPETLRNGRWGWYVAADLELMEEQGWRPDLSVQTGLLAPGEGRRWRLGVGYHSGRVPIGELSMHREPFLTVGLWLEV